MPKLYYDDVVKIVSDRGCEFMSSEYTTKKVKYKIKCSCGNIYEPRFDRFLEGRRCAKCSNKENAKKLKKSLEEVKKAFESVGFELLEDNYENAITKMKYKCNCGNISETTYNQLTRRLRRNKTFGCGKCRVHNISKSNTGKKGMIGEKNPSWNPNRTHEQRVIERKTDKDYKWTSSVRKKYDYTCCKCNRKGGNNVVHHIDSYDIHEKQRHDIENGVVLCENCHKEFHGKYGYGKNTRTQFEEWIKAD